MLFSCQKDVLGVKGAEEFSKTGQRQGNLRGWQGLGVPESRLANISLPVSLDPFAELKQAMNKEVEKLIGDERNSITKYSGFSATAINRRIYGGGNLGRYKTQVKMLHSELSKGIIPENINVYRKMLAKDFGIPDNIADLIGKIKIFAGFTSTSLKPDVLFPGRDLTLTIDIPKGYKGALFIGDVVYPKYKYQEEVLFNQGLTIRIKTAKLVGNTYEIYAEAIP